MSVQPTAHPCPRRDDSYRSDILTVITQHAAIRLNTLCVFDPTSQWWDVGRTVQAIPASETWLSSPTVQRPVGDIGKAEVVANSVKVSDKDPPSSDADVVRVPPGPTLQWESRASRPDYTTEQWRALRLAFDKNAYCSRSDRQRLVHCLNMSPADVQRWFKNARRRERRQTERLQQYYDSEQHEMPRNGWCAVTSQEKNARYCETDGSL